MTQRRFLAFLPVLFATVALLPASSRAQRSCESLAGLKLANTTIASAQSTAGGPFAPPVAGPEPPQVVKLPAFCRVKGTIRPSADSDIRFEVWMPSRDWNGKFAGVGNGGFAGSLNYPGLVAALRAGFAGASTDTGHSGSGGDARWALGHPQKIVDFGYRAIHLTNVAGKAIVRNFYGVPARRSYFSSCSNGGRQALMEAQRFPGDYDGIIAGAPANSWTHLLTEAIWDSQATLDDPASYIPASKLPAIGDAVLAACNANDGVKDGILNDPRECHFDPETLLCHGTDTNTCLTAPQVAALRKLYAGPRNAEGQQIFPGHLPGGELGPDGWGAWVTGSGPRKSLAFLFGNGFFSDMVFDDPAWDFRRLNFGADVRRADKKLARVLNATNPKLAAFEARGGKLILYHGWSDSAISPLNTVNYYESAVAAMGRGTTEKFVRLYMVPGMQHCGGGPGPNSFGAGPATDTGRGGSMFGSLERWVEQGVAPQEIIATKYADPSNPASGVEMARPLCPYPQAAKYKGSGDIHQADNFACELATKR